MLRLALPRRAAFAPRVAGGALFHLAAGLAGAHDLAAQEPEKVGELQALLSAIRAQPRSRP